MCSTTWAFTLLSKLVISFPRQTAVALYLLSEGKRRELARLHDRPTWAACIPGASLTSRPRLASGLACFRAPQTSMVTVALATLCSRYAKLDSVEVDAVDQLLRTVEENAHFVMQARDSIILKEKELL